MGSAFRSIRQHARPSVARIIVSFICIVLAAALAALDPLIMRWIIDRVIPQRNTALLIAGTAIFLGTYGSRLVIVNYGRLVNAQAMHAVILRARLKLFKHLQHLSSDYYDSTPVGDSLFRIEQDMNEIGALAGDVALSLMRIIIATVLIISVMFYLNARLTCVLLPFLPIYILIRRRYQTRLRSLSEIIQSKASERSEVLQENLSAMIQLQLLRCELACARRFYSMSRTVMQLQVTQLRTELLYSTCGALVIVAGIASLLGYGGFMVAGSALSMGSLVAFYSYIIRLFDPMEQAIDIDRKIQRIRTSMGRVGEVMRRQPTITDSKYPIIISPRAAAPIEYVDVSFAYRNDREVLSHISFSIEPGERVALVGKSGSGKSTIAKLLVRLYDPIQGGVRICGTDARNISLKSLRSTIAVMPQDPVLFNASIRENLTRGTAGLSQAQLRDVAQIAQMDAWPYGWDELIGPRGCRLSGGERQRLALARTLLQQPSVLVLDEATSALDEETERRVLDAIDQYLRNVTIIIISHRPTATLWADRILAIDQGQIYEKGKHAGNDIETEISTGFADGSLANQFPHAIGTRVTT